MVSCVQCTAGVMFLFSNVGLAISAVDALERHQDERRIYHEALPSIGRAKSKANCMPAAFGIIHVIIIHEVHPKRPATSQTASFVGTAQYCEYSKCLSNWHNGAGVRLACLLELHCIGVPFCACLKLKGLLRFC